MQSYASYKLSDHHTLRGGFFFQNERTRSNVISLILPTDDAGNPTSDAPSAVDVSGSKTGQLYGVYLQDEWSITGVGVGAPQYGQCRAFFGGIREVF